MERESLTKAQRWEIADQLAKDRLPMINQHCKEVHPRDSFYLRYVKRTLDFIIAAFALIVSLPINLIIGIITFFDVGRPIFFKQERLGKEGKVFFIIKFRNMLETRDEKGELLPPEKRVTKFGGFVRRTSLDELLNFWNILKGEMSLIGPRPLVPEYYHRYSARHVKRMAIRPGLECPPRNRMDHVWSWQEQFENDIWYVENVSFFTDCRMLYNLLRFMLNRKNADARAVAARGTFMGYDLNGNAINLEGVSQTYTTKGKKMEY